MKMHLATKLKGDVLEVGRSSGLHDGATDELSFERVSAAKPLAGRRTNAPLTVDPVKATLLMRMWDEMAAPVMFP